MEGLMIVAQKSWTSHQDKSTGFVADLSRIISRAIVAYAEAPFSFEYQYCYQIHVALSVAVRRNSDRSRHITLYDHIRESCAFELGKHLRKDAFDPQLDLDLSPP